MSETRKQLEEWLAEANELRWERTLGVYGDSPAELHQSLLHVRSNLDRLERILADLMRMRARVANLEADHQAAFDDAWNKAVGSASLGRGFDDPAPRERYAAYSDKTTTEQFELRRTQRAVRDIQVVLEIVRTYHRGLDSLRRDIGTRMSILTFESSLER